MAKFALLIELDADSGNVHVDGPWHDGVLFMGMLEMAKLTFTLNKLGVIKMENKVVVPEMVPPGDITKPS